MDQFYANAIALQEHLEIMRENRDRLRAEGEFLKYHRLARIIAEIEKVLENLAPLLKPSSLH